MKKQTVKELKAEIKRLAQHVRLRNESVRTLIADRDQWEESATRLKDEILDAQEKFREEVEIALRYKHDAERWRRALHLVSVEYADTIPF